MYSIIEPISVNADGVILCKTKFEQNSMGARRIMPIQYGWAIVYPDGKMKEYPYHHFDSDSYLDTNLVFKHYDYLEKIFKKEIDWDNPPVSLLPLIERYRFNSNNIKKYLLDKTISLGNFLEKYDLSIKEAVQRTLQNHNSVKYSENVHILYIINKIVFLKNHIKGEDCEIQVGANFDFYIEYQKELIAYDVFNITGIIKLK